MVEATASGRSTLRESGIDGLALKPTEIDLAALADGDLDGLPDDGHFAEALPETLVVDFEGHDAVPDAAVLKALEQYVETLRVTTPVRADGFDPLATDDDGIDSRIPDAAARVLVAGHQAYLDDHERVRAIAPRLRAAAERCRGELGHEPWIGTEGIERLALAVGGTQFELLSPTVERDIRALRAAGYDGPVAVYAPTVLASDEDAILDAVGDYVARRGAVGELLPAGAATNGGGTNAVATDATATGETRRVLSAAAREYALVGDVAAVRERTDALREAGVDHVVGYPAAGLTSVLG